MAETTKGFKMTDELKSKINSTIETSGMTDKEWIEAVTNLWVMQDMKAGMLDFKKDISEIELHTNRINEVVINMIQRSAFEKEEIHRKAEEWKESKNLMIEECHIEISDLKKDLQAAMEEVERFKQMKDEAERLVRQMEESSENNKLLIQEYKEKNDTLTGLVNDFRQGYEESKSFKDQVIQLTQQNEKLQEELRKESAILQNKEEIHKEILRQTKERHQSELERIIEKKDVEKERELLHLRTEFQDKLQKANEESTAKIQALYERIEQIRNEHEEELTKPKKK
ncbi:hypothetical protein O0550_13090 [Brevibacillus halotolerans]|uniref:hypothetical protein n=1 Tax=Brevibacillus TaxID=55080 RepID=UPI00215CADDC|nr:MULTISPECIES: hypothetical protein [Brevibacillus]MCR8964130.1 hypothetical protein [Brevibacillus laterosporus]MCZ0836285.1 hypothetical protein [Brevibacillus halotolerans]